MCRLNYFPRLTLIAVIFTLASCNSAANPSPYPNISYPNPSTATLTPTELPEYLQLILTPRAPATATYPHLPALGQRSTETPSMATHTATYSPTPTLETTNTPSDLLSSPASDTPTEEFTGKNSFGDGYIAHIPINDVKQASQEEIVNILVTQWLEHYKTKGTQRNVMLKDARTTARCRG